ncbi:hypothetical protein AGMMS49965_12420 [Bacteroidia bacterium]|nr:hypothetical protein AGMMS49965_12420 [Bacteroidia bacterium]
MAKKTVQKMDFSTEDKIKNAARTVFQRKGYAATRTRDIADEAGINLALLNYYFRSKEKLFEIVMFETLASYMSGILVLFNDEKSSLEEKLERLVAEYINFLIKEPEVPIFIMSEFQHNSVDILNKLPVKQLLNNSVFIRQYQKAVADGLISEPNHIHFLMNMLGMVVFPFVGKTWLKEVFGVDNEQFNLLMNERKQKLPIWIKAMMEA